jgi:hypothetical protein
MVSVTRGPPDPTVARSRLLPSTVMVISQREFAYDYQVTEQWDQISVPQNASRLIRMKVVLSLSDSLSSNSR